MLLLTSFLQIYLPLFVTAQITETVKGPACSSVRKTVKPYVIMAVKYFENDHLQDLKGDDREILSHVWSVSLDGVWIGNRNYLTLINTYYR
jgi:hypothetical protein